MRDVFTCVGWQVTLPDAGNARSSEAKFRRRVQLYAPLTVRWTKSRDWPNQRNPSVLRSLAPASELPLTAGRPSTDSVASVPDLHQRQVEFWTRRKASSTVCIGVRAQSTLGGRHFCPKTMYEKLTKCHNFTSYLPEKSSKCRNFSMIFALKINNIPKFYMTFARKIPEFYMITRGAWQSQTWGRPAPQVRVQNQFQELQ